MRKTLFIVTAAALFTFAALEVVAAPAKVLLKGYHYIAPIGTIHVAIPAGTKGFSADLLPQ
jgi:hypothetical protein